MRVLFITFCVTLFSLNAATASSCILNRSLAISIASVYVASEKCPGFPRIDNKVLRQQMQEKMAVDLTRSGEPECTKAMIEIFSISHIVHKRNPLLLCNAALELIKLPWISRAIISR